MSVYVYAKSTEDINTFQPILEIIDSPDNDINITVENKRSSRELENIKRLCTCSDILVLSSLNSLGMNEAEIADQLEWFIRKSVPLVLCNEPATYEYGVAQPTNKAVLSALLHSVADSKGNILKLPENRRSNSGRNRVEFPDDWADLYTQWENKEITSGEFLKRTGLKKATFYNLITEYREIRRINDGFIQRYAMRKKA